MTMRLASAAAVAVYAAWFALSQPSTPAASGAVRASSADIAFASRRDGNWEVYVMDAAGRNQTRLTRRNVEDRFPLWSPDRRRIAFCSLAGGTWELWVMDSDGTNQKRLASHLVVKSTRGWSSDSRRIAFAAVTDSNVEIFAVDASSGQVKQVTSSQGENRDPSWSPDDTQLAFSSTRDGTSQIYVMSAEGSGARRLTNNAAGAVAPRWSPDGKALVFVSDRDLYAIDTDGRTLKRLTTGASVTRDPPLWSPDGSRIVFQIADRENYEIGVVRLSDGVRSRLASSPAYDGSYTWSQDGTRIAFISGRDGFDAVYSVDDGGQPPVRLTRSASLTPAWGSQR